MTGSVTDETLAIVAARRLGLLSSEEVVEWAVGRVAGGEKSEALVQLAALPVGSSAADVDLQLRAFSDEVGVVIGTTRGAALLVATATARDLENRVIEPIVAARRMRDVAHRVPEIEPALREFVGLAGEWEDDPDNRRQYDGDIRRLARIYLSEGDHGRSSD